MKTLVIWTEIPEEIPRFFVVKADVGRFHNQFINSIDNEDLEEDMNKFFFDDKNEYKFRFTKLENPPSNAEFDKIISCGFIA